MNKIAIMQPTYLPWSGYFGMLDYVDIFVFLDDVQFEKRSWQQRNKILTFQNDIWLTVPVLTKGKRNQLINKVLIDKERNFSKKHLQTITLNYQNTNFFDKYSKKILERIEKEGEFLSDLNIDLILIIKNLLNINTKILRSSELNIEGKKSERLFSICKNLSANTYVSAPGSRNYLENCDMFKKSDIRIEYFNYKHPEYHQTRDEFVPFMSIIDMLFNCGSESLDIIKKSINLK